MTTYYPIFLDLTARRCLVVGGGEVAARKVETLLEAGAHVLVVAKEACPRIRSSSVEVREREFAETDLERVHLVVAATDDEGANRAVSEAARSRGVLCNIVDVPDLSGFIVPAILRQGRLTVAVSTSGASPAAAREVRNEIAACLPEGLAEHLDFLAGARERVKAEIGDIDRRRAVFERLAAADVRDAVVKQGVVAAETLLDDLLRAERGTGEPGRRPTY